MNDVIQYNVYGLISNIKSFTSKLRIPRIQFLSQLKDVNFLGALFLASLLSCAWPRPGQVLQYLNLKTPSVRNMSSQCQDIFWN